jgi:hypothetical protein
MPDRPNPTPTPIVDEFTTKLSNLLTAADPAAVEDLFQLSAVRAAAAGNNNHNNHNNNLPK